MLISLSKKWQLHHCTWFAFAKHESLFLLCDHYIGTPTFKRHFNSRETSSYGSNVCPGKMNANAHVTKSLNLLHILQGHPYKGMIGY